MAEKFSFLEKPSDIPDYYRSWSRNLYDVLEDVGATTERRALMRERCSTVEILRSIAYQPQQSVYIFGSNYEGATTAHMGSDIDEVHVLDDLPVVVDCADRLDGNSLLLVQDHTTPAGFCKLQLVCNGKPQFKDHLKAFEASFLMAEYADSLKFTTDNDSRLVCSFKPTRETRLAFEGGSGPALSNKQRGDITAHDSICALRCNNWPECASEWLARERRFNWPSTDMQKACKTFGCIFVPVGHPYSDEKHLQWRVSLSHQERFLVSQFSSVQLKCYILLKIIKKEKIQPFIQDSLSSYHMKTCMLYMIENTPSEFWKLENLLTCVETCLRLILTWTETGICPNYFIPAENMFERRVHGEVRLQVQQLLHHLLSLDSKYLMELDSEMIGQRFQLLMFSPLLDFKQELDLSKRIAAEETHAAKLSFCMSVLNACFGTSLSCLKNIEDSSPEQHLDHLKSLINKLKSAETITLHTEMETKSATSLILPYIEISLLSHQIASAVTRGTNKTKILPALETQQWEEICLKSDSFSSKLKQASLITQLGNHKSALEILSALSKLSRFTLCGCFSYQGKPISPNKEQILNASFQLASVTAENLLQNVIVPCLFFLPNERDVSPVAMCYEMIRTVGLCPESLDDMDDNDVFGSNWAFVDGRLLMYFLMYINHSKLKMKSHVKADISSMQWVVDTQEVSHRDTCLNILGWVYKDMGQIEKAMSCFWESLAIKRYCNAAFWHICITMFEFYCKGGDKHERKH